MQLHKRIELDAFYKLFRRLKPLLGIYKTHQNFYILKHPQKKSGDCSTEKLNLGRIHIIHLLTEAITRIKEVINKTI